ncbi:HipA domain-containing protein [uncultured Senegalimassilia sp.]|uniref:HipA domain-containing protein n=1 Tax=uncultured Senegalimassilia sp. TaxID=1714350 RepID=UPI0025CDCD85|nr:HipA domain-containing protein [uncultured Senegalimassilia sp.]
MREAYAWSRNRLIGRFFEGSDGATRFEYASGASAPISLSLPLDGSWQADAPGAFLDGLLPDRDSERVAMRRWFGAASANPLDLLVATDTTGGLFFTSIPELGEIASQAREFAREKDIAIKVYRLGRGWTTWQSDDRRSRFALAGSQGKFALERFGDRWAWPNAKHPSTHIVKPPHERFCGVPLVEDATMCLAAACGLDVARSFVRSFGEDQAYVVERFDREVCADGQVLRIHVEDFTQALGVSRHAKYSVTAADAFALLKGLSNGRSLVREWAKQLVFNTLVGNCDAHGKNYSLFLRPDGSVDLCPLYDALCTRVWQETSDLLAMPINSKKRAGELSLSDWAAEAAISGICEDDLVETVETIAAQIATHAPAVLAEYPDWIREAMTAAIAAGNQRLFQELGLQLVR